MFDCVMPTRNGRNAYAFTASGVLRLKNAKYIRDSAALEDGCDCHACKNFTRGAIRHFFFAKEMLGPILVSLHNIRFYQRLMADIRQAIADQRFDDLRQHDPRLAIGPSGTAPAHSF
jgi:queuine tRNA-ribosyltransferase